MKQTIFDIPDFKKKHKGYKTYKSCLEESVNFYRGILPDILLNTWEVFGYQSISEGFLWTVNPLEYHEVISDFVYDYQSDKVFVIFRTGFGDLIFQYKNQYYHISAVTLNIFNLGSNFPVLLELNFCNSLSLNNVYFLNVFRKANKHLGQLKDNEVFGFFPHPALGGDLDIANIKKTSLNSYLMLLSEINKK